ncbi:KR domain-containing protein [Aspergillus pseudotamarii]|uniref:KR domain-containing protein n=1 Tax=Aspergillus pseudotamarii TaxID=132259 RepID=A0A5N6S8V3_ASPPS|nr:KR domain-containing protein [Aspergillus pseudotamarii]KAE8131072.1 KR domain-containing protein [Aspergillus pseudotamarii]
MKPDNLASHPSQNDIDEVEIEVKFVGLNFRDVMVALGIMSNKNELGMEASGIVRKCGPGVKQFQPGDRVVISGPGVFRTHAVVFTSKCALLPPSLSLEDAASILVVYITALYCLMDIGRLEKGQSVLIHAACGGVGLAAVQLCQMVGARIYATVGSEQKTQYLIDNFGLARQQVFSSRDTSFLPKLMQETHGQGADIVLNSLAGELLQASWKCVAEFGKMIEIGKRDFMEHGTIGLKPFGSNRAFFGVDLIRLSEKPGFTDRLFRQALRLYEEGKISPIRPLAVVSGTDTPEAFRSLQQGRHLGKLVVKMPGTSRTGLMARFRYQVRLSPNASYILVGGLGGIGRIMASWMVERGARNLIFLSRSAGETSKDRSFIRELEVQGCTAITMTGDVAVMGDVRAAIHGCPLPVAGVLQLSMVVRDQFIPDMSHTDWQDTLSAKVTGTWNLHHTLTECNANLDFFVVCGSITGVMGNAGQANYSAANAFVSSFAQYRRQKGLPASVVNLGGVDDVGFLATQDIKLRERMRSGSVRLLSEQEVMDAFEIAIFHSSPRQSAKPPEPLRIEGNLIVGMSSTKSLADPSVRPLWGQDARFRFYDKLDLQQGPSHDKLEGAARLRNMLATLEKEPEILNDLSQKKQFVVETVKAIQEYSAFARGQTYHQVATMPIDSLMTVEIRNWTRRFLRLDLSLVAITKAATIEGLGELLFETMRSKYLK